MEMLDRKLSLIDLVTADIVQSTTWDMEIALDNSKYANGLLGFSVTGVGLSVLRLRQTFDSFFIDSVVYILVIAAIVGFLVTIILGIWTKKNVMAALSSKRVVASHLLAQRGFLLSRDDIDEDLRTLWLGIIQHTYLTDKKYQAVKQLEAEDHGMTAEATLIRWQEISISISYAALLMVSLPWP